MITIVECRGVDAHGQLHIRFYRVRGHVNVARAEFIERMRDEEGLTLTGVKARKIGEEPDE